MAALLPSALPMAGLQLDALLAPASGGGDTCPVATGVVLVVKNVDAGAHVVTIVTPQTVDGLAVADRTVSVAAGKIELIPIDRPAYRNPSTGLAAITYDGVTSVSVAAIRVAS
jgi:hypothetical protein